MSAHSEDKLTTVIEEYLLLIESLSREGSPVKSIHISNKIKSSPSTVHATLSRMQRDDLIEIDKKKEIKLTNSGTEIVGHLMRRHNLVETFLCDVLKIPWYEVHKHAHVLEHGLTPLVEEKLADFMGNPETCPHGSPMPGTSLPENLIYLDTATADTTVEVVLVDEILEDSDELLKFLHDKDIIPGKKHFITEKHTITNTIVLRRDDKEVSLPFDVASKIGVVPLPA